MQEKRLHVECLEEIDGTAMYSMDKKASDCMKCGACEKRCPYNLPIRKMLEKAAVDFESYKILE